MGPLDHQLLQLAPQYHERVWGGRRLCASSQPIGEAWVAYGPSRVAGGPFAGLTLDELTATYGPDLLGSTVSGRYGMRFPLLIKLLDCADWLSVQVHPDDEQARRLVGPGEFGKTEAWYFLGAGRGAEIILGVKPGVSREELASAIGGGRILEVANMLAVHDGEAILVPAGTIHALGPGILLYEIQQASDTTYRVYDWDRPSSEGRKLHIEESVEVAQAVGPAELRHPEVSGERGSANAIDCSFFDVDLIRVPADGAPFRADTAGRTLHILTVIDGSAEVCRGGERIDLTRLTTALVAGSAGAYDIRAKDGPVTLLRAAVPD